MALKNGTNILDVYEEYKQQKKKLPELEAEARECDDAYLRNEYYQVDIPGCRNRINELFADLKNNARLFVKAINEIQLGIEMMEAEIERYKRVPREGLSDTQKEMIESEIAKLDDDINDEKMKKEDILDFLEEIHYVIPPEETEEELDDESPDQGSLTRRP